MLKLKVNDIDIEVEEGLTVLQVSSNFSIIFPIFKTKVSSHGLNCKEFIDIFVKLCIN